jgi:Bacterial Ig-like domain (group 2)/Putative binding domain, N-terminal
MWLTATWKAPSGRMLCALAAILAARCGSAPSPTNPSSRITVTTVTVGIAGNATPTIAPETKLQLWAVAAYSDGTSSDVTNTAQWKSSNPAIATISRDGLASATTEGAVDITATVESVAGSLHIVIRRAGCEAASLSPAVLIYNAFGSSANVTITTPQSDCRWTAKSDVNWVKFNNDLTIYDPGRSGSGTFSYTVMPNNFPTARSGHIIVAFGDAIELVHSVSQEPPVSCSYVATPAKGNFSPAGGIGSFQLVATPAECRWTATAYYSFYGIRLTSSASGAGTQRVTYTVEPNPTSYARDGYIEIAGLSGANPPAIHSIRIAGR